MQSMLFLAHETSTFSIRMNQLTRKSMSLHQGKEKQWDAWILVGVDVIRVVGSIMAPNYPNVNDYNNIP
jgi:hypothetical protein